MPVLVLKLVLTPLLIGAASLAARRWGPSIGGLIVALPLTTGPVMLFVALADGPAFASTATVGTLVGLLAIAGYSVVYCAALRRARPIPAIAIGAVAYAGGAILLQPLADLPGPIVAVLTGVGLTTALRLLPRGGPRGARRAPPAWDLPGRLVLGTTLVVAISTIAPLLGPHTSGVVATFPLYVSILSVFTHATEGPAAAVSVQRGLLVGLFGTTAFALILHLGLVGLGIGPVFLVAIASTVAIQAVALQFLRRTTAPTTLEPEMV